MIAMWIGYAGALSWLTLMKQHSVIHVHMNPILWYIPFMPLFFALIGESAACVVHIISRRIRRCAAIPFPLEGKG
jgi:hypothetical protein